MTREVDQQLVSLGIVGVKPGIREVSSMEPGIDSVVLQAFGDHLVRLQYSSLEIANILFGDLELLAAAIKDWQTAETVNVGLPPYL
jgi:hypothetical protein